jgi:hypothetical protein
MAGQDGSRKPSRCLRIESSSCAIEAWRAAARNRRFGDALVGSCARTLIHAAS